MNYPIWDSAPKEDDDIYYVYLPKCAVSMQIFILLLLEFLQASGANEVPTYEIIEGGNHYEVQVNFQGQYPSAATRSMFQGVSITPCVVVRHGVLLCSTLPTARTHAIPDFVTNIHEHAIANINALPATKPEDYVLIYLPRYVNYFAFFESKIIRYALKYQDKTLPYIQLLLPRHQLKGIASSDIRKIYQDEIDAATWIVLSDSLSTTIDMNTKFVGYVLDGDYETLKNSHEARVAYFTKVVKRLKAFDFKRKLNDQGA